MKTILVPTDFSETAENATYIACEIAKSNNASIKLCHIYSIPHSSSTVMIDLSDVIKEAAEKEMEELVNQVKEDFPGINVSSLCVFGRFLNELEVQSESTDLIVMGTNGSSGIEEVFLGSNTSNLIQKTETPILAIPSNFQSKSFRKALISLDTKNNNFENNIDYLIKIITILGVEETEILNVQKEEKSNFGAIERFISKVNKSFNDIKHKFTFLGNDNIESAILNHSKPNDLIVVLSKSYGFFERLFHKSISKQLAHHSENPLLVIKHF